MSTHEGRHPEASLAGSQGAAPVTGYPNEAGRAAVGNTTAPSFPNAAQLVLLQVLSACRKVSRGTCPGEWRILKECHDAGWIEWDYGEYTWRLTDAGRAAMGEVE